MQLIVSVKTMNFYYNIYNHLNVNPFEKYENISHTVMVYQFAAFSPIAHVI